MIAQLVALAVIFTSSTFAVFLPVVGTLPPTALFIGQHFGSGVILATGLVHLLEPAVEALESVTEFPLAYALSLGMIFVVLFIDGLQRRNGHGHSHDYLMEESGHKEDKQRASGNVASVIVLESGILFHSVFIGISVAFADTNALAIATVVHQMFEGIGLGARLAAVEWDASWKPRALAWAYALATPLGIAIGLVGGKSSPAMTGVFDALSSGVLLYTGLVELIANELMGQMLARPLAEWIGAYASTLVGAGCMTALAHWI